MWFYLTNREEYFQKVTHRFFNNSPSRIFELQGWFLVAGGEFHVAEYEKTLAVEGRGLRLKVNGKEVIIEKALFSPFRIYYVIREGLFSAGTNPLFFVAGGIPLNINWQSLWDFMSTFFLPLSSPLFEGLMELPGAFYVRVNSNQTAPEVKRIERSSGASGKLCDVLKKELRRFSGKKTCVIESDEGLFTGSLLTAVGAQVSYADRGQLRAEDIFSNVSELFEATGEMNALPALIEESILLSVCRDEKVLSQGAGLLTGGDETFSPNQRDGEEWLVKRWGGATFDEKNRLLAPVLQDFNLTPQPSGRLLKKYLLEGEGGMWKFFHQEIATSALAFPVRSGAVTYENALYLNETVLEASLNEGPVTRRKNVFTGSRVMKDLKCQFGVKPAHKMRSRHSDEFKAGVLQYTESLVNVRQMGERKVLNVDELNRLAEKALKDDRAFRLVFASVCVDIYWKILEKWL